MQTHAHELLHLLLLHSSFELPLFRRCESIRFHQLGYEECPLGNRNEPVHLGGIQSIVVKRSLEFGGNSVDEAITKCADPVRRRLMCKWSEGLQLPRTSVEWLLLCSRI